MTNMILAQHKELVERNQKILDKFIADNPSICRVSRRTLVQGIGVNDADYVTSHRIDGKDVICKIYKAWRNMLERCYSEKFQKRSPTYVGCTVCDEWLMYSAFKRWTEKQDWEGNQLDKDLLVYGNKMYSPETCLYVSSHVNTLLVDNSLTRGEYPQGVYICKSTGKYRASISLTGRKTSIGYYATIKEAESAYIKAKASEIIRVALEQSSSKLMKALIMQASYLRVNFECKQRMSAAC